MGQVKIKHKFELLAEQDAAALERLRAERDRLLAESDWTQMPDSPVDRTLWVTYRQALRDLPNGITSKVDADLVLWPTPPQ